MLGTIPSASINLGNKDKITSACFYSQKKSTHVLETYRGFYPFFPSHLLDVQRLNIE
jgi:hypothetical protein